MTNKEKRIVSLSIKYFKAYRSGYKVRRYMYLFALKMATGWNNEVYEKAMHNYIDSWFPAMLFHERDKNGSLGKGVILL